MSNDSFSCSVQLATQIGLEQAVMVTTFKGWHEFNRHNPSLVRGEYVWCLCSRKQLQETFPFLSDRVIRTNMEKLVEGGLMVKSEQEGKKSFWLAFTAKGLALFAGEKPLVKTTNEPMPHAETTLSLEEKRRILREKCEPYIEKYGKQMIDEFCSYWGEANGNQLRCEVIRKRSGAFEVSRRLATWASKEYNKNEGGQPQQGRPKKPIWEELGLTYEQYKEMHEDEQ